MKVSGDLKIRVKYSVTIQKLVFTRAHVYLSALGSKYAVLRHQWITAFFERCINREAIPNGIHAIRRHCLIDALAVLHFNSR